ncbi:MULTISPECIES: hypothetical protein [unclassified Brevundimonas]|jgi:hypothetical protein|uniref:hypothetical protein n=1 Tax=unclassified Brevundimonas TaxID=2622653 RepID=UPI003B587A66
MKYVKLECKYKGFNYGDVVEIGKDTITEKETKQLIEDKAASLYEEPVSKVNGVDTKALEDKVAKLEGIVVEAIASAKDKAPTSWEEYLSSKDK